jgi:NTP pyrophosphatase (non-canonical NTP hydrolase)
MKNKCYNNVNIDLVIENIAKWHHDRNLVEGSTDQAQYVKLIEEAGELAGNIARGKDITDDIGDMIVVLVNIAERNDLTLKECVNQAWNDIKHRKGKMVDGVFVKDEN